MFPSCPMVYPTLSLQNRARSPGNVDNMCSPLHPSRLVRYADWSLPSGRTIANERYSCQYGRRNGWWSRTFLSRTVVRQFGWGGVVLWVQSDQNAGSSVMRFDHKRKWDMFFCSRPDYRSRTTMIGWMERISILNVLTVMCDRPSFINSMNWSTRSTNTISAWLVTIFWENEWWVASLSIKRWMEFAHRCFS